MDKSKSKNGGKFKVIGNWAAWSKQIKGKFSRLQSADRKFKKPGDAPATVKPD
jgi:hypothetical protein